MEIRTWQSFSCNNSSDFRLVARFGDPKIASEVTAKKKVTAKKRAASKKKAASKQKK